MDGESAPVDGRAGIRTVEGVIAKRSWERVLEMVGVGECGGVDQRRHNNEITKDYPDYAVRSPSTALIHRGADLVPGAALIADRAAVKIERALWRKRRASLTISR